MYSFRQLLTCLGSSLLCHSTWQEEAPITLTQGHWNQIRDNLVERGGLMWKILIHVCSIDLSFTSAFLYFSTNCRHSIIEEYKDAAIR